MTRTNPPDYYSILGVSPSATKGEITHAYKSLATRYHPDRHQGNELEDLAKEKLTQLNEAYGVLSNGNRRAAYDASRAQAGQSGSYGAPPGPPTHSPPDFSKILGSTLRLVLVLVIISFAMRFVRSPRSAAVIGGALLLAWFGPRLYRLLRGKKTR